MQQPQPGAAAPQSSYARFMQAAFNHPAHYPIGARPDPARYRPAATWLGRLILPPPDQRERVRGALFEVHLADDAHQHMVGATVRLRWADDSATSARFWGLTRSLCFDADSRQRAAEGLVLPTRLDGWPLVNPFESLAGALPDDTLIVRLPEPLAVDEAPPDGGPPVLAITREPVQVSGRFYGLVRFLGPAEGELVRVVHYQRAGGGFDGAEELVRLPEVVANTLGVQPASGRGIERSPANAEGWYIYGALDQAGTFVVQALAPRALMRLRPGRFIAGLPAARAFLQPRGWRDEARPGSFSSTLLSPADATQDAALARWRAGDRALLIHLYGTIGGARAEPAAKLPLVWGHCAFGVAQVQHEPLADELIFDITYQQVYTTNSDGVIAGSQHWSRYMGDRQFGWLGCRPVQDLLVKLDAFTDDWRLGAHTISALDELGHTLEVMTARYRIADGRGGTSVTLANNCAQDSHQALYAAIKAIEERLGGPQAPAAWLAEHPQAATRLARLLDLGRDLRRTMLPLGAARADWEWGAPILGSSLSESKLRSLGLTLRSWRTLLPSLAVRFTAGVFLRHGAQVWALRTSQVGGENPEIAPRVPNV